MKHLSCKDLGSDCDFVAHGKNNKEVIDKMFKHAATAHPDILANMDEQQKQGMMNQMNSLLNKQK